MEEGLRFAIREGGRTVGAGVVAKIRSARGRRRRDQAAVIQPEQGSAGEAAGL
jgi:hypothetical protein